MFKERYRSEGLMYSQFIVGEAAPGLCVGELSYGCAQPGYATPRMIRSRFHLQIVVSGTALYNEVQVGAGDVFLMRPACPNQLRINGAEPFCQYWFSAEGIAFERMINVTALRDRNIVKADLSHLFDLLHDGIFRPCHEDLLPYRAAGLLQLVIASLPLSEDHTMYRSPAADYVNRAVDFLRLNFPSGITSSDVATAVGISEKYLCKLFRREMNVTPSEYLGSVRMDRAITLLTSTVLSVAEIASACGYEDSGYFARHFRKYYDCSPTEYRKTRGR